MARWQRKVDLIQEWKDAGDGDDPDKLKALSLAVAAKLEAIDCAQFPENVRKLRDDIAQQFRDIATDEEIDAELFNTVLHQLYDWGDIPLDGETFGKKVAWIATVM